MDSEILYFDVAHAIEVHDYIIEHSGGLHGNRDIGLLESVLDHVQNDMYYPTLVEKLTHLVFSVNKFHAFTNFFINNVRYRHIGTLAGERRISPAQGVSGSGATRRGPAASFHPWTAPVAERPDV